MGVLLERARRVFGGGPRELPAAEPFEIACVCAEHVAGVRLDHRQFVPCPTCGTTHFVLPVNAYPMPTPIGPAAVTRSRHHEEAEPERPTRPLGAIVQESLRRTGRGIAAALWRLVPPARWFAPVRLIIMGTVAAVIATAVIAFRQSKKTDLTQEIVAARLVWTTVVERDGDFAAARKELDRARTAMQKFQATSPERREIEQLSREVGIFADLLLPPREDAPALDDLIETARRMSPAMWADHFRTKLGQPAMLFDAVLGGGPGAALDIAESRLVCRFAAGVALVRLDLSDVKPIRELTARGPRRVLFGARIQAIEPATDAEDEWVIRLVPDSVVLLTWRACLQKIGWPLDEVTDKLLEAQSQWVLERESP